MPSPASPPSAFPPPPPPATAAAAGDTATTTTTPLIHYVRSAPPSAWAGALAAAAGYLSVAARTLVGALWTALCWAAAALWRLLGWTGSRAYGAAAWPTRRVVAAVRFLVSPVTWTVAYAVAPVGYVVRFLGHFRLGAAAFIGIVTGLVLKLFFTAMWPDAADDDDAYEYDHDGQDRVLLQARAQKQKQPLRSIRRTGIKTEPLARAVDGPPDDVWRWLQEYNPPAPAVAQTDGAADEALPLLTLSDAKPRPPGLLSLTIVEESSTE